MSKILKSSYQKESHSKDGRFQGLGVGEAMDTWKQTRALFLQVEPEGTPWSSHAEWLKPA